MKVSKGMVMDGLVELAKGRLPAPDRGEARHFENIFVSSSLEFVRAASDPVEAREYHNPPANSRKLPMGNPFDNVRKKVAQIPPPPPPPSPSDSPPLSPQAIRDAINVLEQLPDNIQGDLGSAIHAIKQIQEILRALPNRIDEGLGTINNVVAVTIPEICTFVETEAGVLEEMAGLARTTARDVSLSIGVAQEIPDRIDSLGETLVTSINSVSSSVNSAKSTVEGIQTEFNNRMGEIKNSVESVGNTIAGSVNSQLDATKSAIQGELKQAGSAITGGIKQLETPIKNLADLADLAADGGKRIGRALDEGLSLHLNMDPVKADLGVALGTISVSPVTANVGGTDKPIQLAPISANIGGGTKPVELAPITANVGGTDKPVQLAPVKMELAVGTTALKGSVTMAFRIFGLKIFSFSIGGDAQIN